MEGAGGTVVAIARPGAKLVAHENGVEQSTVLIEFNSYEAALAAYDCPAYKKALEALEK